MKKILVFLTLVFIFGNAFSQVNKDGLPFFTKYTDKEYGEAGQIWAIEQDSRGIMYFGSNYGLKTYDGKNWKSYNIPNSTILRSMATDKSGLVYYGAEGDFGVILPDDKGKLTFHSLFLDKYSGDSIDFETVWKTLIADDKIYYQAFNKVFYIDLPLRFENDSLVNDIKTIVPQTLFHLSFSVNGEYYIREWERGLCKVVNGKPELIPGGEKFALLRVYVMLPYDDTHILIGTREEGFFLYDFTKKKNAIKPFPLQSDEEIINSAIYNGVKLNDGNFAVGTIGDGIYIFDKNGKFINHFNDKTGLANAYVITMYQNPEDANAPLWFFQQGGIYKADINSPFTVWNKFTGMEGIVKDIEYFNGKLYFVADNNLFYLDYKGYSPRFVKIYSENEDIWSLERFKIPGKNSYRLLMGSFSGIYEVKDTLVSKLGEIRNVFEIYQSKRDSSIVYFGTEEGLSYLKFGNNGWTPLVKKENFDFTIRSIYEDNKYLTLGTSGQGVMVLEDFEDTEPSLIDSVKGLPMLGYEFFLKNIKNNLVIVTGAGLYRIADTTKVEPFDMFGKKYCNKEYGVFTFFEDDDSYWMSVYANDAQNPDHKLIRFSDKDKLIKDSVFAAKLPKKSTLCLFREGNGIWIGNERGLFRFDKTKQINHKIAFNTVITKIITKNDSVIFNGNFSEFENGEVKISLKQPEDKIPVLDFKNNILIFEWAAPFFDKENKIQYSYRLVGESDEWSKWSGKTDIRYTNLYEGDYIFEVKARNIYNVESTVAQFGFTVLPPWYRTIWAYIIFAVAGVLFILLIIKLYTKKLKRENEKLEQIVKERTAEIRMQNEEITAQRDEIQAQKEQVEKAKEKIEKQQKSIMDSIHYASRIQEAVLPPDEYLDEILGEHFVLFRPRDIVSGDFYWATQRGTKTVIVAADCTGHGVPGAFMSMLGMSFLNEIVNKEGILQANVILNRLRENVKKSLRQTGKENEAKDGMDIAVCIIDKTEMKMQFAGAYNPLLIIRDGEISRIKADRMPIGIYLREKESFTNNIIDIQKGDLLYIFSDGYVDQFGGENGAKIRSAKFKEVLLENHKKPLDEQKAALVRFLEEWMNYKDKTGKTYKQVDDILVVGIEI